MSHSLPSIPGVEMLELLAQCAESKVYKCRYGDKDAILKHRFAKAYRHASLDTKLRLQRTQREAKALTRAKKFNVSTPNVFHVDKNNCTIVMEEIKGKSVRDAINEVAAKIPHEILRTRANDVFLRTVKVEEAEGEGAEEAPVVNPHVHHMAATPSATTPTSPQDAINANSFAAGSTHSPLSPAGATHILPKGHGVSTGNSSHPHNHFAVTQGPPSAAAIVAASGLQLTREQTEEAIANLAALDSLGKVLLTKMGAIIGCLHNGDMIHGDLTTSNFLTAPAASAASAQARSSVAVGASPSASSSAAASPTSPNEAAQQAGDDNANSADNNDTNDTANTLATTYSSSGSDLVIIDFGLVRDSTNAEERAVDLYVLQRAVASAHPYLSLVLETILLGYNMTVSEAKGKATMDRLVAVRARGRKRSMIG